MWLPCLRILQEANKCVVTRLQRHRGPHLSPADVVRLARSQSGAIFSIESMHKFDAELEGGDFKELLAAIA